MNRVSTLIPSAVHRNPFSVHRPLIYHATVADRMKLRPGPEMPEL